MSQRARRRPSTDEQLGATVIGPRGAVVPPFDLAAEAAVLSALLITSDRLDAVRTQLPDSRFFYSVANRHIYDGILALADGGNAVDHVTVAAWLRDHGRLAQVTSEYIVEISDATPALDNVEAHATVVREKWRQRAAIQLCQRTAAEGYAADGNGELGDVQAWLEGLERAVSALAQLTPTNPVEPVGTIIARRVAELDALRREGKTTAGTPTTLVDLDRMTGGLYDGDLYIVAARPGLGKSSLATTIAHAVATPTSDGTQVGVAFFSLEMPRDQIAMRFAAGHGVGIASADVRRNDLTDADWATLQASATDLLRYPIYVDDTPAITLAALRARSRRLSRELEMGTAPVAAKRLGLIVVDYLQLMTGERFEGDSREREVAGLSAGLKNFAKELGVPVLAVSQLNRAVEQQKDKRPTLTALRESGALEQDADHVWLLYRDSYYEEAKRADASAELIIAKQRNGPTGTVKLYWDARATRFRNLALDDRKWSSYDDLDDEDLRAL